MARGTRNLSSTGKPVDAWGSLREAATPLSGPKQAASRGNRAIVALNARSGRGYPRCDVRVGSGATRTKVLPKFSPRSISAKAVGMTSNPSRMSSR